MSPGGAVAVHSASTMTQHVRTPYYSGGSPAVGIHSHALNTHNQHSHQHQHHPHGHTLSSSLPITTSIYMSTSSPSGMSPSGAHNVQVFHSASSDLFDGFDDAHDGLAEVAHSTAAATLNDDDDGEDDEDFTDFEPRSRRHSEQVGSFSMQMRHQHQQQQQHQHTHRTGGQRMLASSMSLPHGMLTSGLLGSSSSPKTLRAGSVGGSLHAQLSHPGSASDLNPHAHPFVLPGGNGKPSKPSHRQVVALQRGLSLSGDEEDDGNGTSPQYARARRASANEGSTPSAESLRRRRHSLESIDFRFANVVDVPSFLRALRLHKYTDTFTAAGVTMESLLTMEEKGLAALGVSAQGARRRLLLAARKYADSVAAHRSHSGGQHPQQQHQQHHQQQLHSSNEGLHLNLTPPSSLPSASEFLAVPFDHFDLMQQQQHQQPSQHQQQQQLRQRPASPSISVEGVVDPFRSSSPSSPGRAALGASTHAYLHQTSLGRTGSVSSMGSIEEQPFGSDREHDGDSGNASSPHGSYHGDEDDQLEASLRIEGERLLGMISDGHSFERSKSPVLRVPSPNQLAVPHSPTRSPRKLTPSSSLSSLHSTTSMAAAPLVTVVQRNPSPVSGSHQHAAYASVITAADVEGMPGGRPVGMSSTRSAEAPAVLARNAQDDASQSLQPNEGSTRQRRRHSIAVVNHSYYWRKPDIRDWLRSLRLHKYTEVLLRQGVDFERLSYMTEDDMANVGVTTAGARKRLTIAMDDYRRQMERAMAAISAGMHPQPLVMPAGFAAIGGSETNSGTQSPATPGYAYSHDGARSNDSLNK
eukprot:Opistho-2@11027